MILRTSFFLALRNFRHLGGEKGVKRLVAAIVGVFLSLIPLIVVIEVTNGMIQGITNRFIEVGTFHLQAQTFDSSIPEEYTAAVDSIQAVEGVTGVYPFITGLGLLYSPEGRTGTTVRAVPPDMYSRDEAMQRYLSFPEGGFSLEEDRAVLVSKQIAEKLNVSPGDTVKLLTAKIIPGRPVILRPNTFTVQGVFTTGYHELDALTIYIPLERGKRLFASEGRFSMGIKVDEPYEQLRQQGMEIQNRLASNWYVYTWYELEKSMYHSFETTKNLLVFIMALIVCVASVNISSTLIMIVLERQNEIAFLKCTGTSPQQIVYSFVMTGFLIGIIGTVLGVCGGLLISIHINSVITFIEVMLTRVVQLFHFLFSPFLDFDTARVELLDPSFYLEKIPITIRPLEMVAVGALAIFLATAASYFPARKAGKIKPLDILRKH
jgi:lipoprotein-releasing system permease protein